MSYASEDRSSAEEVIKHLTTVPNLQIFNDNSISAGEDWESIIRRELDKSDYFLVLLSPASIRSKWVQFELGAAWGLDKFIIPVVTTHDVISKIPVDLAGLRIIEMESLKNPDTLNEILESHQKAAA